MSQDKRRRGGKKHKPKKTDAQQRLEDDLHHVMGTERGRRFMWWLLSDPCRLFDASYAAHSNETAMNEGKRRVGITLLLMLQDVMPETYSQMVMEQMRAAQLQKIQDEQKKDTEETDDAD